MAKNSSIPKSLQGKRVCDPITRKWSTGDWMSIYNSAGQITEYLPIWRDSIRRKNEQSGS